MINPYPILDTLLFRYRKVTEFTIEELISNKFVLSSSDCFNDSHDLSIGYDLESLSNKLREDHNFISAFANESKRDKTFEERISYLKSNRGTHVITEFANILAAELIRFLKGKFLIGCFTHDYSNQVMWSHYGDYNKGFIVGYDKDSIIELFKNNDSFNVNELFNDVCYENKTFDATNIIAESILESIENNHIGNYSEIFLKKIINNDSVYDFLFVKNPCWEYEKEKRLLVYDSMLDGNSHYNIGYLKPSVLILGEDISFSNKYLLTSICKKQDIPLMIIESCYKNNSYKLSARIVLPIEIDRLLNNGQDFLTLDGLVE